MFNRPLDEHLVTAFIGLRARTVHRGAFAAIEHSKLNAGRINGLRHQAAERIDLAHDLPFGDATDCWIATHLPYSVQVTSQYRDARSGSRGSRCGFGPCMSSSDDNHIKLVTSITHVYQRIASKELESLEIIESYILLQQFNLRDRFNSYTAKCTSFY